MTRFPSPPMTEGLPLVTIGAPVRNRAWILPRYLDALERLDYPKERLAFHWIVNDSMDATEGILHAWKEAHFSKYRRITIDRIDFGPRPMDTFGAIRVPAKRDLSLPVLAELRNRLFEDLDSEYFFGVDSDIIVNQETLKCLLSHKKDVCAALVRNGIQIGDYIFLLYNEKTDRFYRNNVEAPNRLFEVGLTGACCLYSWLAATHGIWSVERTGEDEGLARSLRPLEIAPFVDGTQHCEHVMGGPLWP